MGANKSKRQGVKVKTYTDAKVAMSDLEGLRKQFRYFRDKKQRLKDELIEMGQYADAPTEYRYEMSACRTMLGILEVQITKTRSQVRKLQKEESYRQLEEEIRETAIRDRERRLQEKKMLKEHEVTDENGISYYVTEEHRKELMTKIMKVANEINEKGGKGGYIKRWF